LYQRKSNPIFAVLKKEKLRELSSAGSEHLPYKQRVTGSNPVVPTSESPLPMVTDFLFLCSLELLPHPFYKFYLKNIERLDPGMNDTGIVKGRREGSGNTGKQ
jgi:hypothetical protein